MADLGAVGADASAQPSSIYTAAGGGLTGANYGNVGIDAEPFPPAPPSQNTVSVPWLGEGTERPWLGVDVVPWIGVAS